MSLASLLGTIMAVLQAHPMCRSVTVVETKQFSNEQFFFKVRAELLAGHKLQVRIYYNLGHTDYAYQVFGDVPLLRWDNKEDFPHLHTYPHHYHDEQGSVVESSLTGDMIRDLEIVLRAVSDFLAIKRGQIYFP